MHNESKILVDNVKNFRKQKLDEAADPSKIRDAINNHKVIYIYYGGDNIVLKGYRTIRPFVLGTHEQSGNKVVRAWQDHGGNSDSFSGVKIHNWVGIRRKGHEYFTHQGKDKPGWRLFRLDKITSILPTGEIFDPEDYFDVDGVKYKPNDGDMVTIDAAISRTAEPDVEKGDKKYKQFFKAANRARQITKNEVESLVDMVKKKRKKSLKNYWVYQNERGDMVLSTERGLTINDIPKEATVGNLRDLYIRMTTPDDKFFNQQEKTVF